MLSLFARFRYIVEEYGTGDLFRRSILRLSLCLLRPFPKDSVFRNFKEDTLALAVKKLNHRPRKCLGYRTPHEVFQEARHGAVGM